MAKQCSVGCSSSPLDEIEEVVEPIVEVDEEIDRMVVLPEIRDAGEADRTEVLSVDSIQLVLARLMA